MDSIELLIVGSKSSIQISDLSLEIKHTTCLGTLDNSLLANKVPFFPPKLNNCASMEHLMRTHKCKNRQTILDRDEQYTLLRIDH